MKLVIVAAAFLALSVAACGDDDTGTTSGGASSGGGSGTSSGSSQSSSGSSSTSTSTNKFTCKLNGACYECPTSKAVIDCASKTPSEAGCTSASDSVCN